ncbi:uncharacterized protein LOC112054640 [Bicyclus anynana]|uniref:Uncharacterized protein LOC112054640 n=1 Tax=Bicyclus anynana TaxID=110368 RepID=A0ABM3LMD2_BICAN|nr:uncharacterized protein LOC112054640 [Bicyclus anynana]
MSEDEKGEMKKTTSPVYLTEEQFNELLNRIPTSTMNKNFTRCMLRFNGERDHLKVEEFVTAVEIYKKVEKITDEDALIGFPLLLKDTASTWWTGIQAGIKTWPKAISALRSAFAPKRQPYEIYVELFADIQGYKEPIDTFLCRKRALLGMLPTKRHREEEQLDLIYGLLKVELKKEIARSDITTFAELLEKARHLESLENVTSKNPSVFNEKPATNRCLFCGRRGHKIEVCRKRSAQMTEHKQSSATILKPSNPVTEKQEPIKSAINCYGCGTPGVFRSNCEKCKLKESPPKPVSFFTIETNLEDHVKIPTIEINIYGQHGYAFIDTAARTSIASNYLYQLMLENGAKFREQVINISLADGTVKQQNLLITAVEVTLGKRTIPITLSVLPDAKDNRTLLGIDFLDSAGIILNLPQRFWTFADMPDERFDFLHLKNEKIKILKKAKKISFKEEELSEFLQWSKELHMISPIQASPSPIHDEGSPPKRPRWQLIKLDTPPRPVHPREPADQESELDPRVNYLPINPMSLYSLNLLLQPNEAQLLTNEEKTQLNSLLVEFNDIFNEKGSPTNYTEHRIETGNCQPIAVKPYRLSPARQQQLKHKLDEMISNDIIEECNSPWSAPVILVPKGQNDVRVCIDYRQLNEVTKPDRYPLPRIDDLLHQAKAMPYMSTIDLQSGYWQIKVHADDQAKTAFISKYGIYKFKRMPFGLRNAPATFQRLMDKFVHGLKAQCVLCYLDDLIIRSETFSQHLIDLNEVFAKLRDFNLRANRKKCQFGCSKIKYLGHLIVPEGIKTDMDKISAIANRPEPRNLKQLISFLQTASWYRRFIQNFAEIARPLTNLTKKKVKWQWCDDEQKSYESLKRLLTTAPILKQADYESPFTIKTDASNYAIGAALVQGEGSEEHPIQYASRLLTPAECNYTVTEKEATAQQCALTLLNEVFLRYGLPRRITSDNGTQFISAVMQQLTYCLGIQQILTPVYHPEPNIVERKNRDMKTQIAIMVQNKHIRWPETLPAIRFSMNSAYNQSTGFTAGHLTFGREMRTPYKITHNFSDIVQSEKFIPDITPYLRNLANDLDTAKANVEDMQDKNRQRANQKR